MENDVKKLIEKPLNEENIFLDSVVYLKEDNINFLRITLLSNDIDTCIKASNIINPILDNNDITNDSYVLDVCTKGSDK